jgi:hypothetical protein
LRVIFFVFPEDFLSRPNGSHNTTRVRRTKHLHLTTVPSKSLTGAAIRAGRKVRVAHATDTHDSSTQEAFPSLPQDVVVTHILRSDTDPIVLARLRAVSRAMRDAVDTTGLSVKEVSAEEASQLGYLDTLKHKAQRRRHRTPQVLEPTPLTAEAAKCFAEIALFADRRDAKERATVSDGNRGGVSGGLARGEAVQSEGK